jgi:hypothetical protein
VVVNQLEMPRFTVESVAGGDGPALIVVDFLQFTAGRRPSTVLAARNHGHAVYRVDPISDLTGVVGFHDLPELADGYSRAFPMSLEGPVTVIGYCSAAALAVRIAEKLRHRWFPAAILLIQPTFPSADTITGDFRQFRADLGASPQPIPLDPMAPEAALSLVGEVLAGDLAAAVARQPADGLPDAAIYQQLIDRHRAWLSFLLATCRDRDRPWQQDLRPRVLLDRDAIAEAPWLPLPAGNITRLPVTEDALVTEDVLPQAVFGHPGGIGGRRHHVSGRPMSARHAADVVDSIPPELAGDFDALNGDAGAAGCYDRITERQQDSRWRTRYVRITGQGRLLAAIPVFASTVKTWRDPDYDPVSWQPASTPAERLTPDRALLVGGSADQRSSLHVAPGPQHPALAESALRLTAALAAAEGRGLVFPYFSEAARDTLTAASAGRIAWRVLAREAHFGNILDPRREDRLSSRVRGVLRHDRRLLAQADLTGQVTSWPDMAAEAADLIAAHNIRKGKPDHPEFVHMRYQQWEQCRSIRLVVFTAAASDVSGLLTALVWRDDLELYEIGLTGSEGPHRLAVYLSLLFHQPFAFARQEKLRNIRAGTAGEIPKSSRGATLRNLYGGVLDAAATARLAA